MKMIKHLIDNAFLFYCDICCRYHSVNFDGIPKEGIPISTIVDCVQSINKVCGKVKRKTLVNACLGSQQHKMHLRYLRYVESTGNDYLNILKDYIEYQDRWQFIMREWIGSIEKQLGLRIQKIRRYNTMKERWIYPKHIYRKVPDHVISYLDIVDIGNHQWVCLSFNTIEDLKTIATDIFWQLSRDHEAKGYVDIEDPDIKLEHIIITARKRIKELRHIYKKGK